MFDIISDICSISGFIVSIGTFIYAFFIERRVREFEKKVLFNTRIPILIADLANLNSKLSKDLGIKNARDIRNTLNLSKAVIEDIISKLPYELNKQGTEIKYLLLKQYKSNFEFENIETKLWKFWIQTISLNNLWESYDKLNAFITRIDNLTQDKKII